MFVLAASLCIIIGILCTFVLKNHRYMLLAWSIPSATSVPIIGDLLLMAPHNFAVIQGLEFTKRRYGDIFRIWTGKLLVVVSNAEYMETLCTNPAMQDRGAVMFGFSTELGSKSLIVADWDYDTKQTKKAFHRNFNTSSQEIVLENFRKANNQLLKNLQSKEGEWINIGQYVKTTTSRAVFGAALDSNLDDYPDSQKFLFEIEELGFSLISRGVSELHKNDFMYHHLFGGKHVAAVIERSRIEIRLILLQKKKSLSDFIENRQKIPNQFIYNLLQENTDCDMEDVVNLICTLLIASIDTSAATTEFTLLMLAMHPEIQQLVYEEDRKIQEELNGQDLNEKTIAKYEYLGLVIKEVLRMYPSIPILPRVLREDVKLGKYTVPKGVTLLGSVLSLHRDPKVFKEPLLFKPERFILENLENIPKYAYIPFGVGPRNCPGVKYGTQSVTFIVTTIIRNFKIYTKYRSTEELDSKLEFVATLNAKGGYPLLLKRRGDTLLELPN